MVFFSLPWRPLAARGTFRRHSPVPGPSSEVFDDIRQKLRAWCLDAFRVAQDGHAALQRFCSPEVPIRRP